MLKVIKKNLNIFVAGFGCCKQEIYASRAPLYDIEKLGVNFVSLPESADLLIIQGLINKKYAERVIAYYKLMKKPKWAALLGTCVIDNCIFGSNKGIDMIKEEIPIDVYIPGCPPRPEAFIYAILRIVNRDDY